jgi:vitamin B12 transporter
MITKATIVSILLIFSTCFSAAAIPDTLRTTGDTIWISSYTIPLKMHETGRDIQVTDMEAIKVLPAVTADEVMRYIPGLEVQARGPSGVQADLSLRGSTFSQVLVMIDGMRWNDPLTGHFSANLPIQLSEIDRIEVIKGPGSSHYGADAMGGVINIVTRTATDSYSGNSSLSGHLSAGGHNFLGGGIHFHQRLGEKTLVSGGLEHMQSDGHEGIDGSPYWFDITTASLAVRRQLGRDWSIFYRAAADRRDFSARYFYTASPLDKAEEYTRALWNQLQVKHNGDRGTTTIDLAHKRNRDRFVFNPDFPSTNSHVTSLSSLQLNHWLPLGKGRDLHTGLRGQLRSIESNDRGDHRDYTVSVFGGFRQKIGTSTDIHLSLSLDQDRNFGFEINPQFSASHRMGSIELNLSAGRSIRAADYTERFISTALPGPLSPGRNLGNPNLSAERAKQVEIGMNAPLAEKLIFHAGLFYRNGRNIIDYVPTPTEDISGQTNLEEDGWYFYARNIGEVRTRGIEMRMELKPLKIRAARISATAGWTINDIKTNEDVTAKYITGQARHLLNLNMLIRDDNWTFSINSWYKNRPSDLSQDIGAELSSEYFVVNSKLERSLFDKKVSAFLQINNIFDRDYSDIIGVRMPGRWLMAGAAWNIGG